MANSEKQGAAAVFYREACLSGMAKQKGVFVKVVDCPANFGMVVVVILSLYQTTFVVELGKLCTCKLYL